MKKLLYFCLFFFGFFCTLFCVPFSNSTTSALSNLTYRTVNFYSGSNLLYSYSVENGKSLNDYDNLLTDGTFSSLNSTFNSNNWVRQYLNDNVYLSGFGSVSPNNNSINIGALLEDPVSTNNTLHIVSNSGFKKAGTYTFSVNILNATYGQYSSVLEFGYINSSGGFTGFSDTQYRFRNISSGVVSNTYTLSEDTDNFAVRLYISFGTTMSIEYFRLEERSYATPYFSKQYISDLYRQENNLTSSDVVYWSENSYGQFDFDTPINENINLYGDTELYNLVNFYGEDRLSLLTSYIIPYGTMLKDFVNINELKQLYFENSDITNIDDYDILLTDDYYSYSNYFNFYFIITDSVDLYCTHLSNVINYGGDYTPSKSSDISLFTSLGSNLLNDINLNSIIFEYNDILIDWKNDGYIFQLYLYSLPNSLTVGEYFDIYTDSFGNKFYYKYVIAQGDYSYSDTINYSYEFTSYLYRINLIDINNVYIPPFNVNLFITYDSSSNKYVYLDSDYYFWYNDSFINRVSLDFDISIDYNMNYYYADYFGFSLNIEDLNAPISLRVYDNLGYSYGIFGATPSDKYFLINSEEFQSSYINKIRVSTSYTILNYMRNVEASSYDNLISSIEDNTFHLEFINPKIFFYNPTQSNGNNLVPTTPTSLYKEKSNWYDFGTDIYNTFIYLLFEAPIISNITQLIYIIISLIMNVINLIIGVFSTVKSSIFIAMILGFLLFKFVISKFIGGSS